MKTEDLKEYAQQLEQQVRELQTTNAALDQINKDLAGKIEATAKEAMNLAFQDTLTSLPNRRLFLDRLSHSVESVKRTGKPLAVMFIDLDRFKVVNDTLGHSVGDMLLQEVSARLLTCVRTCDTVARHGQDNLDDNTVARLGGDEFTILLTNMASAIDASVVAKRILERLSEPFELNGQEVYISASVGIVLYSEESGDLETLLRNADVAMYRAKESGRDNFQFYAPEMNARAHQKLVMETELRHALERDQFLVYYQPQLDTVTGQIIGAEALLRWKVPERGIVSPLDFIPLLEDTGLIVAVGEWVLQTACAQTKLWHDAGLGDIRIAINLSSRQFDAQGNLTKFVADTLSRVAIDPELVELEITESTLMKNIEVTQRTLKEIKAMNVRISLDDFGTGYSSLAYLKLFDLDVLKIDRSFIRFMTTNADEAAIVKTVIDLAHHLKMDVVTEGVENKEQLELIRQWQCESFQGFLFSPPVPAADFERMLVEKKQLGI